mgnify:CR=1 FL=1
MSVIKKAQEELKNISTAKSVTGVLRDISAMEIDDLREEFAKNQNFYIEISELYRLVKAKSEEDSRSNLNLDPNKEDSKTDKSEKVLLIAVTSNRKFFGELNKRVMEKLIKDMDSRKKRGNEDLSCKVIGKTGKQFLMNTKYENNCQYIIFKEDDPDLRERQYFLKSIGGYDKVFMFYPKFINVFRQGVEVAEISYTPELIGDEESKEVDYFFEPELSEIMNFFETQVKYLLFSRAMLETKLSRTATRLIRMNTAEEKADNLIKKKRMELKKELSSLSNMRLLEIFAGFKQWQKKQENL